jgi:ABC-2 type transport system permease protein
MDKIGTIVGKEWSEVFKNRLVLFTVLFLPLIFAVLPLGTIVAFNQLDAAAIEMGSSDIGGFADLMCADLTPDECAYVYTLNLFVLMFMILPIAIPVTIASYSIVGEKTTRSLEPLLATPITTVELLLAKMIAAIAPAIVATWLAFGIFLSGARLLAPPNVFNAFFDPMWLIAVLIVAPLLTLLSTSTAVIISSRVTDPRVAEQMSVIVILPLILLIVGQSIGLILIDRQIMLVIAAVVIVLDALLFYLSVKLFQRETILTRWK